MEIPKIHKGGFAFAERERNSDHNALSVSKERSSSFFAGAAVFSTCQLAYASARYALTKHHKRPSLEVIRGKERRTDRAGCMHADISQ